MHDVASAQTIRPLLMTFIELSGNLSLAMFTYNVRGYKHIEKLRRHLYLLHNEYIQMSSMCS